MELKTEAKAVATRKSAVGAPGLELAVRAGGRAFVSKTLSTRGKTREQVLAEVAAFLDTHLE